jgi:hypothetical protein
MSRTAGTCAPSTARVRPPTLVRPNASPSRCRAGQDHRRRSVAELAFVVFATSQDIRALTGPSSLSKSVY